MALGASSGTGGAAAFRGASAGVGEVGEGKGREEFARVGGLGEERGEADTAGGGVVGGELGAETGGAVLAEAAGFEGAIGVGRGWEGEGGGVGGEERGALGGEVDFEGFLLGVPGGVGVLSESFGRVVSGWW